MILVHIYFNLQLGRVRLCISNTIRFKHQVLNNLNACRNIEIFRAHLLRTHNKLCFTLCLLRCCRVGSFNSNLGTLLNSKYIIYELKFRAIIHMRNCLLVRELKIFQNGIICFFEQNIIINM